MHSAQGNYRIGIDLGGTKTEAVLLSPDDRICIRERFPTPQDGYDAILENVRRIVQKTAAHIPTGTDYSIGMGIPGSVNPATQCVQNANTTCLIGRRLQRDIEERIGRPVYIENDANCFTLAECVSGAVAGFGLVFGIIMGTGCGGGLCINRAIHRGRHSIAGEWGHVSIDPRGTSCYCGNRGCVETKISGSGIEKEYESRFGEHLSMVEITGRARAGDMRCREVFDRFLDDFGRALGGLISVLDPDAVVLGGGLSNIDELYSEGCERMRHYVFHGDLHTPIVKNSLGDSAGVLGAAWLGESPGSFY